MNSREGQGPRGGHGAPRKVATMQAGAHQPMLQVEQLSFAFAGQAPLLHGWSGQCRAGVTWLQGDTGSGKTTLLRLLAGQLVAPQGSLRWCGQPMGAGPPGCGPTVFSSDDALLQPGHLTAALIEAQLRRQHPGFDGAAWQRQLEGFGLAPHLAKPMLALSSGGRHKLRLAAALSAGAELTLLDEPTAGLDAPSLRHLWGSLREAHAAADRVLVLAGGQGPDDPPWPVLQLPL